MVPISGSSRGKVFPVKTTMSREVEAAKLIYGQHEYKGLSLRSILVSPKTKGYVFVESPGVADVLRATEDIKLAEKVVETPLSSSGVKKLLDVQWTSVSKGGRG